MEHAQERCCHTFQGTDLALEEKASAEMWPRKLRCGVSRHATPGASGDSGRSWRDRRCLRLGGASPWRRLCETRRC